MSRHEEQVQESILGSDDTYREYMEQGNKEEDDEQLNYYTAYERSKSRAPHERARSRTLGGHRGESP
jgi:hypothetical protein